MLHFRTVLLGIPHTCAQRKILAMTSISTPSISTPSIQLPIAISNEIIAHARAGKPEEICGILRGRGLVATQLIQGRNIADERIENYEVDPQTLLRQFEFEDAGDVMMGI